LPEEEYYLPLDKAEIVRSGADVTVSYLFPNAAPCSASGQKLWEKEGYDPEVIVPAIAEATGL
jgi:pyruvate dehydrogenase E1 component beta subunit